MFVKKLTCRYSVFKIVFISLRIICLYPLENISEYHLSGDKYI